MKELEALMNGLNEKMIPEALRLTARIVPIPKEVETPEQKQALLNMAIRNTLLREFKEDKDLMELFAAYSSKVGMNALISELAIKAPEQN